MSCGRKQYILLDKDNNLLVWGQMFKGTPQQVTEGFSQMNADELFDGGSVKQFEARYMIYGAVVENL